MASEVFWRHTTTGEILYFTIRNTSSQMWSTAGTPNFESLTVANWLNYVVVLTETPASSYFFVGTFPAISGNMVAGWYYIDIYRCLNGSPATSNALISDLLAGSILGYWDGTSLKPQGADMLQITGQTVTCGAGVTVGAYVGNATAAIAVDGSGYVTKNNIEACVIGAGDLGNYSCGSTIFFDISTTKGDGTPCTATLDPLVYRDDYGTGGAVTSTFVDANSKTGRHRMKIDTSIDPTFYIAGSNYTVILKGTSAANGISLANTVVASFALEKTTYCNEVTSITNPVTTTDSNAILIGTVNTVTNPGDFTLTSSDLSTNNNDYDGMWLIFTNGSNKGICRIIDTYTGGAKQVQFTGLGRAAAFPQTVSPGDAFLIMAAIP